MNLVDGGFTINSDYSPAYIYELAKMDSAIVISEDLKKINGEQTLSWIRNIPLLPLKTGTRYGTCP